MRKRIMAVALGAALAGATWRMIQPADPTAALLALCAEEVRVRRGMGALEIITSGAFETGPAGTRDFMGWADDPSREAGDRAEMAAGTPRGQALAMLADMAGDGDWTVARLSLVYASVGSRGATRCAVVVPGPKVTAEALALAEVMLDGRRLSEDQR
jgi:hypothetical protein